MGSLASHRLAANMADAALPSVPGAARGKDPKEIMTEGPDDGTKNDIQFSDMPKSRRPKTRPQENYVPQASSASATTTKLLQKRRKNNEWQQSLESKREEFARRMAECDARQAELKKKCKDLRKRVQTKEQEVQETRSRINRATKKQEEEKGSGQQKEEEIREKRREAAKEEADYAALQKKLERTTKYKQYLDLVCDENEGSLDEVDLVLQRYDSLAATEADLQKQKREGGERIQKERENVAKYTKRATTELVEKNAQMAQMRSQLEQMRSDSFKTHNKAMKLMEKQQQRMKDHGSIKNAVENLFDLCFVIGKEKQSKTNLEFIDKIRNSSENDRHVEM